MLQQASCSLQNWQEPLGDVNGNLSLHGGEVTAQDSSSGGAETQGV